MEIGPWVIKKNPDTEAKEKPYIVTKRVRNNYYMTGIFLE